MKSTVLFVQGGSRWKFDEDGKYTLILTLMKIYGKDINLMILNCL